MIMKRLIFSIAVALTAVACDFEGPVERPAKVVVNFEKDYMRETTKSSVFGAGIESVETGAVVAFYDAETRRLDSQCSVESLDAPMRVALPMRRMDVYVLGNLWFVNASGAKCAPVFPVSEDDVPSMTYHLGGASVDGLRPETFAEVAGCGIPVCGSLKGVQISSGSVLNVRMERLFAKLLVSVDHSGMSTTAGVFRNEKLYLRQANGTLAPFAEGGARAETVSDVLATSDYESPMADGTCETFVFYVPENRMGTLLAGNADPAGKTWDALRAAAGDAADRATYVEFSADIDRSAGGYGGSVTYRFYPGADNVANFDIVRNKPYNVNLSFNVDSVFEPTWKVDPGDDFEDRRLFCVTKDAGFSDRLPENQPVVVRKNRAGNVYVYMNRTGAMGSNDILGKPQVTGYVADGLSDCAWGCDFSALAANGMSASYSLSSGRISISVTDPSRFVAGRDIPLTLRLYPGGKTCTMTVRTSENQELVMDRSDFYMGMKRHIELRGFAGGARVVRALGAQSQNLLRTAPSTAQGFLSSSPSALSGTGLDIYAYGISEEGEAELQFSSDDTFNDDAVSLKFKVFKPEYRPERKNLKLYVDGTGVPVSTTFYDRTGRAMEKSAFDPSLYDQLLALKAVFESEAGDKFAGFNGSEFFVDYLGGPSDPERLEKLINSGNVNNSRPDCLGSATVKPASPLYDGSSRYSFLIYYPYVKVRIPEKVTTEYFNEFNGSELDLHADIALFGNKRVSFSSFRNEGRKTYGYRREHLDEDVVRYSLVVPEGHPMDIPVGLLSMQVTWDNPRVREGVMAVSMARQSLIQHNATLGPVAFITPGSPVMTVRMMTPKAAWLIRQSPSMLYSEPEWKELCGYSLFYNYIKFKSPRATGPGQQVIENRGGSNSVSLLYADVFPESYPGGGVFDANAAERALSRPWVFEPHFEFNGASYYGEIPLSMSGNAYLHISPSSRNIGYVLIE